MYRNEIEIQIFGLQRSGNHGVVAWMAQQFDAPIVFLNNIRHFADPYVAFRGAAIQNTISMSALRREGGEAVEVLRRAPKPVLIYNYENLSFAQLADAPLVDPARHDLGASRVRRRALILRDAYNWLASRLRLSEKLNPDFDQIVVRFPTSIRKWLDYAREFAGETRHLHLEPGFEVVPISYNRWAGDTIYRAGLLDRLGLPTRRNINPTIADGVGGSSFDTIATPGSATDIAVQDRWRYLLEPRLAPIRAIVERHRDAIEPLNQALFGAGQPF